MICKILPFGKIVIFVAMVTYYVIILKNQNQL